MGKILVSLQHFKGGVSWILVSFFFYWDVTSHSIHRCLGGRCHLYLCCWDFLFLLGFHCLGVMCLGVSLLLGVLPRGHRSSWIFKFTTFGNIAAIVSSSVFFFFLSCSWFVGMAITRMLDTTSFHRCSSFLPLLQIRSLLWLRFHSLCAALSTFLSAFPAVCPRCRTLHSRILTLFCCLFICCARPIFL